MTAVQAVLVGLWLDAIQVERPYRFESTAREDTLYTNHKLIG